MAKITSSPITFLDLTDQQQLSAYLTSNLSTVQFRGTDDKTYNPSWENTPLIITLHAFLNQIEIDYVSGDYTFKWYVKDGVQEELIQEGTSKTLVIDSNKLGESTSGMLTYVCEISCSDAETITTEITYTLIGEGKPVTFYVESQNGLIFKNQSGEITLKTIKYYGVNEITANDADFQWYRLTANGEEIIEGATKETYTVNGQDVSNIASYRCVMTYNEVDYSDVITLQDVSDNYASDILTIGGTVFKNGIGGSAVYAIVRANGHEEDALAGIISMSEPTTPEEGEYWYYIDDINQIIVQKQYQSGVWMNTEAPQSLVYTWSLMDKEGNITPFGTGKVTYLSSGDIKDSTTLCCEISTSEGKLLSMSQETFIDLYDSYNITITPDIATVICDYHGNIIKQIGNEDQNSSDNTTPTIDFEFKYFVTMQDNPIAATWVIENIPEGLTVTEGSEPGSFKISMNVDFNFENSNDFTLPVKIQTLDKYEVTFERYITFIKIKEGEGVVNFSIHSSKGDTFKEGMSDITLDTIAYYGSSVISDATYAWYYYQDNGDDDLSNDWHQIYEEYQTESQNQTPIAEDDEDIFEEDIDEGKYPVTTSSIVIPKSAEYAFLPLKCVMQYNNMSYEAYILLKDDYNSYTANIKFFNESNVFGVDESYIIAYMELSKNNTVVDSVATTRFYYSENNTVANGVITTDDGLHIEEDERLRYFICKNTTTVVDPDTQESTTTINYSIILGEYNKDEQVWSVVESPAKYVYTNNLYANLNSNIVFIPKEDVVKSKELIFSVYNISLDDDGSQLYNDELLIAKADIVIVNLNDKLGNIVDITNNVDQYMDFHPTNGLTISQKDSNGDNPFSVNITSKEMGFYEYEDKVVYISNNAANITNITVEKSATFNCDEAADFNCAISVDNQIDMINTHETEEAYPGFSLQIEPDGSLSIVKLEVN